MLSFLKPKNNKEEKTDQEKHIDYHKKLNANYYKRTWDENAIKKDIEAFLQESTSFQKDHIKHHLTFALLSDLNRYENTKLMLLLDEMIEEDEAGNFLKDIDLYAELKRCHLRAIRLQDYIRMLNVLWKKPAFQRLINESNMQVSLLNILKDEARECLLLNKDSFAGALEAYLEIPEFYQQHPYIPESIKETIWITHLLSWKIFYFFPNFFRFLTVDHIEAIIKIGFPSITFIKINDNSGLLCFLENLMLNYTNIINNSMKSGQNTAATKLLKILHYLAFKIDASFFEKNPAYIFRHHPSFREPLLTLPAYFAYFHYHYPSFKKEDHQSFFEIITISFNPTQSIEDRIKIFLKIPEESLVFCYQQLEQEQTSGKGLSPIIADLFHSYISDRADKTIDPIYDLEVLAKFAWLEEKYKTYFIDKAIKTIEEIKSDSHQFTCHLNVTQIRLFLTAAFLILRFAPEQDHVYANLQIFQQHFALKIDSTTDPAIFDQIKEKYASFPDNLQNLYREFISHHSFLSYQEGSVEIYRQCEATLNDSNVTLESYDEASLRMAEFILSENVETMHQASLEQEINEEFEWLGEEIQKEENEEAIQDLKEKGKEKEKEKTEDKNEDEIEQKISSLRSKDTHQRGLDAAVKALEYLILNALPAAKPLSQTIMQRLNTNIENYALNHSETELIFDPSEDAIEAIQKYYPPLLSQDNLPLPRLCAIETIMKITRDKSCQLKIEKEEKERNQSRLIHAERDMLFKPVSYYLTNRHTLQDENDNILSL